MREIQVRVADLTCPTDQAAILRLLNHYAEQPFGMGKSLPLEVQQRLIPGMIQLPSTRIFLAFNYQQEAVGLAVCFLGFSSFKALPLLNIHDLVVHESSRGLGIGGQLIDSIAQYAVQQGCCSVTLEVRQDNPAKKLYSRKGFRNLQEEDPDGVMLFGKLALPINPA